MLSAEPHEPPAESHQPPVESQEHPVESHEPPAKLRLPPIVSAVLRHYYVYPIITAVLFNSYHR